MFLTENGLFQFVAFLSSGGNHGFEGFWDEAGPGIRQAAAASLRQHLVVDKFNHVDSSAVDDVEADVVLKLKSLAARPGRAAFDPERVGWSPAGLAKWLRVVVGNAASDWCDKYHGANRPKTVSLDDLELNAGGVPAASHKHPLDSIIRSEEIEKVRRCLNQLSTEDRFWLEQTLIEGVSQHELARQLKMSPTTVWRRVDDAKDRFLSLFLTA